MLAITCGSWIDLAMWSMNTTSTTTSTSTSAIVTVIDRCGTNSPWLPGADRDERQDRVDERRNKAPERDLGDPVANEVAQHARAELRGGERQRHDRDREHERHHRDHRRCDRGEDLPGGVRGAADHERREVKRPFVGRAIQCVGDGEQRHGQHDLDRRHQPQVRPQRLAPPRGREGEPGAHVSCTPCGRRRPSGGRLIGGRRSRGMAIRTATDHADQASRRTGAYHTVPARGYRGPAAASMRGRRVGGAGRPYEKCPLDRVGRDPARVLRSRAENQDLRGDALEQPSQVVVAQPARAGLRPRTR